MEGKRGEEVRLLGAVAAGSGTRAAAFIQALA